MEDIDVSVLEAAGPALERLLDACGKGTPLHRASPSLAGDVCRQAGRLQVAIDNLLGWARPRRSPLERTQGACSWCHEANDVTAAPALCKKCGHRADVPRLECDCARCRAGSAGPNNDQGGNES